MAPLDLLFLSGEDIEALALDAHDILAAVEVGLRAHGEGRVEMPPKDHLSLEDRYRGHFNILKAYVEPIDMAGVKVIGDYVDNFRLDLPSELSLLTLYAPETGAPLAILNATRLTWMRTGAVTAIGAKFLARPGSKVLGHVGARGTAWYNVPLLDALFDFDEVRVASNRRDSRERFATAMAEQLGKPVHAVDSVAAAVEGADIVVDASRLSEERVLVESELIKPGALVMPYGAVRSTDARLPFLADKFVVDDWRQAAASEYGHYYRLIADGTLRREHVYAEIGEIVAGRRPAREADGETIVFWHRGFAVSDVVLGKLAYDQARAAGVGTTLTYAAQTRDM